MANQDGGTGKPFRVLALDGGGIRGYYTARLLELLLASVGGDPRRVDFGRAFDLIVGTSSGSLLGAALASGVPLARVSALYREHGAAIFPRPAPIGRWSLLWCAAHWRRASADVTALRGTLEGLFGSMTLDDLYAQRGVALCVTATDLGAARGRVFSTPHGAIDVERTNLALVDVCIASSSPPMLLPPIRLPQADKNDALWCDGGLWATSPVAVAIDEALAVASEERPIEILSVGTCAMRVPGNALADVPVRGIGLWIRGLRALQVAGDAQARAAVDFARRVVPQLRRDVRLVRLRDPEPTDEEATVVRLDNARPAAFEAMEGLARRGAALNRASAGELSPPDLAWLDALLRGSAGVRREEGMH
jgi:predicted acylesterase/phospholipase RssA